MSEAVKLIFYFLVFPGLVFASLVGLLACWLDRKVTARIQYRQGPPLLQPLADICKLLGKEVIVPEGGSVSTFLLAPLFGLSAVTLVAVLLWFSSAAEIVGFIGDVIVVLYLLVIPSLAVIIGGSASRSPFSALGASREMKLILAYEIPFLIAVLTAVYKTGTISLANLYSYQIVHGMLGVSWSGAIAFVVALLAVQTKLGFVPFDIAEAEQEVMGGPLLEYSGAPLAAFKLTKAILLFVLPIFLIILFWGGIFFTLFGIMWFAIKYLLILTLIILIKNTNPRIRIDQALRFFWGPVTALAAFGFILAIWGW